MQRYIDSLTAMSVALNLMIDEEDTLLVAAIAHPVHLIAERLLDNRTQATGSHHPTMISGQRP